MIQIEVNPHFPDTLIINIPKDEINSPMRLELNSMPMFQKYTTGDGPMFLTGRCLNARDSSLTVVLQTHPPPDLKFLRKK